MNESVTCDFILIAITIIIILSFPYTMLSVKKMNKSMCIPHLSYHILHVI